MKKENIILSYILSKSLFFGLGISYIISNANINSGLAIIIGYLIGGLLLFIINKKRIIDIKNNIIGKILLFFLITIIYIIVLLSFSVQTTNFYLQQSPALIIAISFFIVCIYGASKKINSYKRLNQLLFIISILLTVIGIVGNIGNIDINNFKPFFYHLDISFIKTVIIVIILSITPNILLLSIDDKISSKELLTGYFLSGINILLLVSSTIGTLGITLAKVYRYPEYIAFEKIVFLGFIERMENILAFIWLIDLISLGILSILNLYNIINKRIGFIILLITTYLTVNYFIKIYQNTMYMYHYIFIVLFTLIVPIIFISPKKR